MGTWKQEAQSIGWDLGQNIKSTVDKASNIFDSLVGGARAQLQGVLNGSAVVGMNVNEIPNMRAAIRDYINQLEEHLNQVRTNADTTQAFKGEYATAIQEYVSAICEACKCVTSSLLAFSDKLVAVQEAYQARDAELKSAIGSSASDVQSSFSRYQEQR